MVFLLSLCLFVSLSASAGSVLLSGWKKQGSSLWLSDEKVGGKGLGQYTKIINQNVGFCFFFSCCFLYVLGRGIVCEDYFLVKSDLGLKPLSV